jgi:hypothetical protein
VELHLDCEMKFPRDLATSPSMPGFRSLFIIFVAFLECSCREGFRRHRVLDESLKKFPRRPQGRRHQPQFPGICPKVSDTYHPASL